MTLKISTYHISLITFPSIDFSFPCVLQEHRSHRETGEFDFMRNCWKHVAPGKKKKSFLKYGKVHTLQAVAQQVSETPPVLYGVCTYT